MEVPPCNNRGTPMAFFNGKVSYAYKNTSYVMHKNVILCKK